MGPDDHHAVVVGVESGGLDDPHLGDAQRRDEHGDGLSDVQRLRHRQLLRPGHPERDHGQPSGATVSGNGTYNSGSVTFDQAGTYYWAASYGGDTNNKGATSTAIRRRSP